MCLPFVFLFVFFGVFFFVFFFFFEEENVLLAFCLSECFDCGVVTLNASFFLFGVLERKVLGNCTDSYSLLSFLF